ncbi:hypothetical protein QR680_007276 [Steinernema hermaphroditum]|uniref:Granulins domain-containing protein n=1 Tax=Steinernema hermaphroditum TaxID=289476 RepID=A0AA39I0J4_9BILA|nr:hypothetical protein QR680_007276 [Steinernema hermaphroditum]
MKTLLVLLPFLFTVSLASTHCYGTQTECSGGCCPFAFAVCCPNGRACCPFGNICDEVQKVCRPKMNMKKFHTWIKPVPVVSKDLMQ